MCLNTKKLGNVYCVIRSDVHNPSYVLSAGQVASETDDGPSSLDKSRVHLGKLLQVRFRLFERGSSLACSGDHAPSVLIDCGSWH